MSTELIAARANDGPEVVTIGEVMALLLAEPGVPLRAATAFRRSIAGAEANVAIGLARLGHRVQLQTRLSADAFGDVAAWTLRAEGVAVHTAVDHEHPTGLLVRDCHSERAIEVVYHRAGSAASALSVADLDVGAIASARLLHMTGITPALSDSCASAAVAAIAAAREAGTTVVFDPNVRRKLGAPARLAALLRPIAALADIILAGDDEAELVTGASGAAAAAWFLDRGARLVVLKSGAKGAWATDGSAVWSEPAQPVTTVDPVGAGDAFAAGFLHALLHGQPVDEALTVGATVGALVVQVATDIDGLPTLYELQQLNIHGGVRR